MLSSSDIGPLIYRERHIDTERGQRRIVGGYAARQRHHARARVARHHGHRADRLTVRRLAVQLAFRCEDQRRAPDDMREIQRLQHELRARHELRMAERQQSRAQSARRARAWHIGNLRAKIAA